MMFVRTKETGERVPANISCYIIGTGALLRIAPVSEKKWKAKMRLTTAANYGPTPQAMQTPETHSPLPRTYWCEAANA